MILIYRLDQAIAQFTAVVNLNSLSLPAVYRRLTRVCLWLGISSFSTITFAAPYSLPKVQELAGKNIDMTALVVDLSKGKILAQYHADKRVTPASVSKIFIDAAALDHWGPNYRFFSKMLTNGPIENGVLKGNLMFLGKGDPELTANRLWLLVMRLKQLGVKSVQGDLIINDSLFGPIPCDNKDRCDALETGNNGYDAPLSAAGIGYSVIELTVIPGKKVGEDARIEMLPPGLKEFELHGSISTVARKKRPLYGISRTEIEGKQALKAYGRVPLGGGPYRLYRSVADPAMHTGQVLHTLLKDADIQVQGRIRTSSALVPKSYDELESIQSAELSQILRAMMTFSNNYMADVLTLGLAAKKSDDTSMTLPQASKKLEDFAQRANQNRPTWLQTSKPSSRPLVLAGGSGLNPDNKVSARDIVSVLAYMYDQPELFPSFVSSLSVPDSVSSRMLRRWASKEWKTRIAVKTGYLSEPRSAIGLGGYFRLKNGGWGAFACIANGTEKRRSVSSSEAIGSCREDMQKILKSI